MDKIKIIEIVQNQRNFFASGRTKDVSFRLEQLKRLKQAVIENEDAICRALKQDLGKPAFEAYTGDIASVVHEIDHAVRHLRSWAKSKRVKTPFEHLPGASYVYAEPFGIALIIGPWNFPVQLMLCPLVAAISAGNCALLKPSKHAADTSDLIARIIEEHFDPGFISVVEGGAETSQALLVEKFDFIFFTGGPATARSVMAAAAKHLTPVVLELGGKNPCIVDADVNVDVTARRVAWGKFYNAGQNCVAPDYLLAHKDIKEALVDRIKDYVREFYGEDPQKSPDFARIVSKWHFDRLCRLLERGKILIGGKTDASDLYISPTLIEGVSGDDPVMQEEIFGPILPVLVYEKLSQAIAFVNKIPKPLALYIFSRNKAVQDMALKETSSGGGCVNDTVLHETSVHLPFGGAGESGIGKYHGKSGFDAFSNMKSVMKRGFLAEVKLRYPPYKDRLKLIKKIF